MAVMGEGRPQLGLMWNVETPGSHPSPHQEPASTHGFGKARVWLSVAPGDRDVLTACACTVVFCAFLNEH